MHNNLSDPEPIDDPLDRNRKGYERKILIAVIVIPVLLGLINTGMHYVILESLRSLYALINSYQFIPLFLESTFACSTILLVLRHPVLEKPFWPSFVTLAGLAIFVPTQSYLESKVALAIVLFGPVLIVFLVIRALGRFCMTSVSDDELPSRGPFSILRMFYWITAFALCFAIFPPAFKSVYDKLLSSGMTLSYIPWLFAPRTIAIAFPMLTGLVLGKLSWKIRLMGIAVTAFVTNYAIAWLAAWSFKTPMVQTFAWIMAVALCFALPVCIAFWWSERGGRRLARFPK